VCQPVTLVVAVKVVGLVEMMCSCRMIYSYVRRTSKFASTRSETVCDVKNEFGLKVKGPNIALNERTHLRATERHLSYGITQCYLLPDRGERAPP